MAKKKVYPKYQVWWETSKGVQTKQSLKKRKISYCIEQLQKLKTFRKCRWRIVYGPKALTKYKPQSGAKYDHFTNESIEYTDPVEAFSDFEAFVLDNELKSCKVPVNSHS